MKTTTHNPDPDDDPNNSDKDAFPTPPEPRKANAKEDEPNLVAGFYESQYAAKTRGFLVPYAAQIVFIARMCGSTRLTAAFLSEKFNRKVSRRPVEDILKKVSRGEIVITRDELADVAKEHPTAQRYAELNPDILDPGKPAKKTGAKKAAKKSTKKVAKASKPTAKKTTTKKSRKTPRSGGPDPGPELPGFGQ